MEFRPHNLEHIQARFEAQTGVTLPRRRPVRRIWRTAALVAVVAALLTVTAFGAGLFPAQAADDLHFSAVYEGDGLIQLQVENGSGQDLRLQPQVKLLRWTTGQEVPSLSGSPTFSSTEVPAHSTQSLTVDLSQAYNFDTLEEPGSGDWYYLLLTDQSFLFGHDWMCSVDFFGTETEEESPLPSPAAPAPDADSLQTILEPLRFYFEAFPEDLDAIRALDDQYVAAYTSLLAQYEGRLVPSVSPVLPGNRLSSAVPWLTARPGSPVNTLLPGCNWSSMGENRKYLATQGEYALVFSLELPLRAYEDAYQPLPLLYLFTYEKAALEQPDALVFLSGRLLSPEELAPYQVYEDERYVCYEVSPLLFPDLEAYVRQYQAHSPGVDWDSNQMDTIRQTYEDARESLGSSLQYVSSPAA